MHKILDKYVAPIIFTIGILLFIASFIGFIVGIEVVSKAYERIKPVLPYLLTGIGLIVLASIISPKIWIVKGTGPGGGPAGHILCEKCGANNDAQAKFCDQCGVALFGHQPSEGIRVP
jgi:hypothetical protein